MKILLIALVMNIAKSHTCKYSQYTVFPKYYQYLTLLKYGTTGTNRITSKDDPVKKSTRQKLLPCLYIVRKAENNIFN